jgi:hypothetical protein
MEPLSLHVSTGVPVVLQDESGESVAIMNGINEIAVKNAKRIADAVNNHVQLLQALISIYTQLDNDKIEEAKKVATEAYFNATKSYKIRSVAG